MKSAGRSAPIFRMFDVAKAEEFYVDFLGFNVDWRHQFEPDLPVYMQVSRGGVVIHLSEHFGDGTPGSAAFFDIEGIEEFQKELLAKKYRNARPGLGKQDWGLCLDLTDPFGNKLRFCENKDG